MDCVFSLTDALDNRMGMRNLEKIQGLDALREQYADLSEEDFQGQYSYLYVLVKK